MLWRERPLFVRREFIIGAKRPETMHYALCTIIASQTRNSSLLSLRSSLFSFFRDVEDAVPYGSRGSVNVSFVGSGNPDAPLRNVEVAIPYNSRESVTVSFVGAGLRARPLQSRRRPEIFHSPFSIFN